MTAYIIKHFIAYVCLLLSFLKIAFVSPFKIIIWNFIHSFNEHQALDITEIQATEGSLL